MSQQDPIAHLEPCSGATHGSAVSAVSGAVSTPARAVASLAALALGVVLTACGDDLLTPRWGSAIDTVQLYTLARPELGLPSAYSFTQRRTVRIEAPTASGSWDLALDTESGGLVFLPPGALGISSTAGIDVREGETFEEVEEASRDTANYALEEPVPVQVGTVYVVRTGQSVGSFGTRCVYYAKMEPLETDPEVGTVSFLFEANPICNDPRLVPTQSDDG